MVRPLKMITPRMMKVKYTIWQQVLGRGLFLQCRFSPPTDLSLVRLHFSRAATISEKTGYSLSDLGEDYLPFIIFSALTTSRNLDHRISCVSCVDCVESGLLF